MSLNWEWAKKGGTITMKTGDTEQIFPWYEGNAMMIVLHEFTDESGQEMYNLAWFFCDEQHAKKCLGLAKGTDNMLRDNPVTSLTIYRENSRQWQKIAELFARAFPDAIVSILPKAPA